MWYDLAKAMGKAFVKRHLSQSDEPTSFTSEELVKYFGSEVGLYSLVSDQAITVFVGVRKFLWIELSCTFSALKIARMEPQTHRARLF